MTILYRAGCRLALVPMESLAFEQPQLDFSQAGGSSFGGGSLSESLQTFPTNSNSYDGIKT
jgi:pantothenate kinase